MLILEKILFFFLIMSILVVLREGFAFVVAWIKETKMEITTKRMVILASAISYIFTIIFTGFKLIS